MVSLVSFWNHKHHPCPVTLSQGAAAGLPYHTGSHLPAEIGPWPPRRRSSCATRSRTFCGVQPTYPSHTQTAQGRTASRPFNRIYTLIPSALTCWADWAGVWSSLNFAYLGHPNWSMYCVSNPGFCSNPRFCTKSSCGKHQMQENNSVGVISLSLSQKSAVSSLRLAVLCQKSLNHQRHRSTTSIHVPLQNRLQITFMSQAFLVFLNTKVSVEVCWSGAVEQFLHPAAHRVEGIEEDAHGKEEAQQEDQDIRQNNGNEQHRTRIMGHQKQE